MKKLSGEEISAVVLALIGNTAPVADSAIDGNRMENLDDLLTVADCVLDDIARAADHAYDTYASSSLVGVKALNYLSETMSWLEGRLRFIDRRA